MSEIQNSSKYDEHAEGLARFIREIANEEIDRAFEEHHATERAITQDIRDRRAAAREKSDGGCRCNSANGTREAASANAGYIDTTKGSLAAENISIAALGVNNLLGSIILHLEFGFAKSEGEASLEDRCNFEKVCEPLVVIRNAGGKCHCSVVLRSFCIVVVPQINNLVGHGCEPLGCECHNTSPSRSGLEAATSSSPTVTVSENTSAGAVSPSVPAHPRFVPLMGSVYDRERDRFTAAISHSAAWSIADELNERPSNVINFEWEDAK